MAELLIKAVDATNPDPTKDRLCGKRGDVVEVQDDGFVWGSDEAMPPDNGGKFFILELPGVPKEELEYLKDDGDDGVKRKHKLNVKENDGKTGRLKLNKKPDLESLVKVKPPRA